MAKDKEDTLAPIVPAAVEGEESVPRDVPPSFLVSTLGFLLRIEAVVSLGLRGFQMLSLPQ